MKTTATILSSIVIMVVFASCNSDSNSLDDLLKLDKTISPNAGPESINFAQPVSGQHSKYVRYTTECGKSTSVSFTGDTLEVTISGSGSEWQLTESFTEGSPMIQDTLSTFSQTYLLHDAYALIKERRSSQLFWFYGNDTLFFNRRRIIALEQDACRFTTSPDEPFIGDEMGHFDEFRIGQIVVTDKKAVSCIPMWIPFEAYLIYNEKSLSLSHTLNGDLIVGWLQIE
ncbi:MAG: hypothetical protein AAFO69_14865 [Bacteroidota bacterium]